MLKVGSRLITVLTVIILIIIPYSAFYQYSTDAGSIATILGSDPEDIFGYSVKSGGDLNGDGIEDILVGAPGADNNTGAAYIFFGVESGLNDIITADSSDNAIGILKGNLGYKWKPQVQLPTGSCPYSIYIGDANNDGYNDTLSSDYYSDKITIYNGTPDGGWDTPTYIPAGQNPSSVFIADVNNDGYNDILSADYSSDTLSLFNGTGSGGWEPRSIFNVGNGPSSVFCADVNNDSYNDIVVANYNDNSVSIFNGTASSNWESRYDLAMGAAPRSVFVSDANNDGYNDILTGDENGGTISLRNGTVTGDWEPNSTFYIGDGIRSLFVADANNDGYNDIVAASYPNDFLAVLNGTKDGIWEPKCIMDTGSGPRRLFVADASNDGYNDILVTDYWDHTVTIYNGTGSGVWEPKYNLSVGHYPIGIFVADINDVNPWENLDSNSADIIIKGEKPGDRFGRDVSGAGDLNGDGFDDIIVGAPGANKTYVYYGGEEMGLPVLIRALSQHATKDTTAEADVKDILSENGNFYTVTKGQTMFIDSFNISGLSGNITSAILHVEYFTDSGYNAASDYIQWALDDEKLKDTSIRIEKCDVSTATASCDLFPLGVKSLIDIALLDISFTNNDNGGNSNVNFDYVWLEVHTTTQRPMIVFNGTGDYGFSVSGAGDLNGDNLGDIIIGAPDLSGSNPGEAFIKYGNYQGFDDEPSETLPAGWKDSSSPFGKAVVNETEFFGSSGKSIEFESRQNSYALIHKSFKSSSTGVVEYHARSSAFSTTNFAFKMWNGGWNKNKMIEVAFGTASPPLNMIIVRNDTTANYWTTLEYQVDIWYHFKIVFDCSNQCYDLYIDELLALRNAPMINPYPTIDTISFEQVYDTYPQAYVDNVVFIGNASDINLSGDTSGMKFGYDVSSAGDLDADNYDDYIIGSPGKDKAFVYFGKSTSAKSISASNANVTIKGTTGDKFGSALSNAGDINNDNYDDIIIGAPNNNSGRGTSYIFKGDRLNAEHTSDKLIDLALADTADVVFEGDSLGDRFGAAVGGAGDFNKDGYCDIVVGAPNAQVSSNGIIYVFYCNSTVNGIIYCDKADYINMGENPNDLFGTSVASISSFSTTDLDNVIVGAPYYDNFGNEGKIYIIETYNSEGIIPVQDLEIQLTKTYDLNDKEAGDFAVNEIMVIRTNVTNLNMSSDITFVNITILAPDNSILVDDLPMTLEKKETGNPAKWKLYNYTYINPTMPGTYTIEITAISNRSYTDLDMIKYQVEPGEPFNIISTPVPSILPADGSSSSNVIIDIYDKFGNPIPGLESEINVVLDEGGGDIGPLTGYGDGIYNFTYTSPTKHDPDAVLNISVLSIFNTTMITLNASSLHHIDIIPSSADVIANRTQLFEAKGFDEFDYPVDLTGTIWASTVGTFDIINNENSTFRASKIAGSGIVSATVGAITGFASVNVTPGSLARIELEPKSIDVIVGSSQSFTATGYDEYDNVVELVNTVWSVDVGSIVNSGDDFANYQAPNEVGIGTITATGGSITGSSLITIIHDSLDHIEIIPKTVNVTVGKTFNFSAVGYDKFNNEVQINPFWSTNVGSMNGSNFSAQTTASKGFVNASASDISASSEVNLIPDGLDKIVITPNFIEIKVGKSRQFTSTGYDRYYNEIEITPSWSSNVGKMDGCTFTAQYKIASGFLNATYLSIVGSAVVQLIPEQLQRIEIEPEEATLVAGTNQTFYAYGYDKYNNSVVIEPVWFSTAGDMDNNILYAQTDTGFGVVSASYRGISGSSNVTIIPDRLNSIFVYPPVVEVNAGGIQEFSAIGYDQYNNTVIISPSWSTNVGEMNDNIFTAKDESGIGTVTASVFLNDTLETINGYADVTVIFDEKSKRPTIIGKIPNQQQYEDCPPWTFSLSAYENDEKDSGNDLKWFVTGENTSLYTLTGEYSDNDILKFTPVPNAFGSDEITLWLIDSDKLTASQTIWVNLTPVNDKPSIYGVPDLVVRFDDPYTFNLEPYVSDLETSKEELEISTLETTTISYIMIDGLNVTFSYPKSMLDQEFFITLVVFDGEDAGLDIIKVTVTDNWVPKLYKNLPDVVMFEGSVLMNVFNLDDYFYDRDSDSLYYSYGQTHVVVRINDDHTVDMASPDEWSGIDTVTFRAEDPEGALVEDTISVLVYPVNDAPTISGVPDIVVHYDHDYRFDLTTYINDIDNETEDLKVFTSEPEYIRFDQDNHMMMVVNLPESMNNMKIPVTISVSDGFETAVQSITITVSDDYPPEIFNPLPDIDFYEDTEVFRVFDLDSYFKDIDGDTLFYLYGNTNIIVTINDDNTVNLASNLNWFGTETVTFRAEDPYGALAEDTIIVTVLPVNDEPSIKDIPDQVGKIGRMWVLDLTPYIGDVDNTINELKISIDSDLAVVSGMKLVFYSDQATSGLIAIDVSDGEKNTTKIFKVTFKEGEEVIAVSSVINWSIVIIIIIITLGMIFVYRKYNGSFAVEEVFLIYENGNLIAHKTNKSVGNDEKDDEIISSMLTALQDFVKESFECNAAKLNSSDSALKCKDPKKSEWQLQELNLEGHKILIRHGKYAYLAVIFSGKPGWKLNQLLNLTMSEINAAYSKALSKWNGNMDDFAGIENLISPLIEIGNERITLNK